MPKFTGGLASPEFTTNEKSSKKSILGALLGLFKMSKYERASDNASSNQVSIHLENGGSLRRLNSANRAPKQEAPKQKMPDKKPTVSAEDLFPSSRRRKGQGHYVSPDAKDTKRGAA